MVACGLGERQGTAFEINLKGPPAPLVKDVVKELQKRFAMSADNVLRVESAMIERSAKEGFDMDEFMRVTALLGDTLMSPA